MLREPGTQRNPPFDMFDQYISQGHRSYPCRCRFTRHPCIAFDEGGRDTKKILKHDTRLEIREGERDRIFNSFHKNIQSATCLSQINAPLLERYRLNGVNE